MQWTGIAPLVISVAFVAGCGDGATTPEPTPADAVVTTAPGEAGSAQAPAPSPAAAAGSDGASFLEIDYAEGIWCASDGPTWLFTDGNASVSADGETFTFAGRIEQIFVEPAAELISIDPEEFVVDQTGREVIFSRGTC